MLSILNYNIELAQKLALVKYAWKVAISTNISGCIFFREICGFRCRMGTNKYVLLWRTCNSVFVIGAVCSKLYFDSRKIYIPPKLMHCLVRGCAQTFDSVQSGVIPKDRRVHPSSPLVTSSAMWQKSRDTTCPAQSYYTLHHNELNTEPFRVPH